MGRGKPQGLYTQPTSQIHSRCLLQMSATRVIPVAPKLQNCAYPGTMRTGRPREAPPPHPSSAVQVLCVGYMISWEAGGFSMSPAFANVQGSFKLGIGVYLAPFIPGPQNIAERLSTCEHSAVPSHRPLPSSGMLSEAMKPGSLMLGPHLLLLGDPFKEAEVTRHPDTPLLSVPCASSLGITALCKSQGKFWRHSLIPRACIEPLLYVPTLVEVNKASRES